MIKHDDDVKNVFNLSFMMIMVMMTKIKTNLGDWYLLYLVCIT